MRQHLQAQTFNKHMRGKSIPAWHDQIKLTCFRSGVKGKEKLFSLLYWVLDARKRLHLMSPRREVGGRQGGQSLDHGGAMSKDALDSHSSTKLWHKDIG